MSDREPHDMVVELSITAAADLLVNAATYHEAVEHEGEACPLNRVELLAYVAFRMSVPPDAFDNEEIRAAFESEVRDRDACYAEHVVRDDD